MRCRGTEKSAVPYFVNRSTESREKRGGRNMRHTGLHRKKVSCRSTVLINNIPCSVHASVPTSGSAKWATRTNSALCADVSDVSVPRLRYVLRRPAGSSLIICSPACVFESATVSNSRAQTVQLVATQSHCSRLDADDEEHGVVLLGAATHLHR